MIVSELAFEMVQEDVDYTLGGAITGVALPAVTGAGTLTVTYTLKNSAGADVNATGDAVPGLTFAPAPASRMLTGTPTAAGGATVLTYAASNGTSAVTQTFTVTVPEPVLADISDMTFAIGDSTAVSLTLPMIQNVDSSIGMTYALTGLAELPGLAFDATTRILSGTPTGEAGSFPLTYTATTGTTASITTTYSDTQSFMVEVRGGPVLPLLVDQTYPLGTAITALTLSAGNNITGFTVTYALTDLADVPGLAFDATSRVLSGTPTTPGETELTYTVTVGGDTVMRTFTVTVTGPTLSVADLSYPVGDITSTILPAVAGIDGGLGRVHSLTGPNGTDLTEVPGLAFDAGTRALSGTLTTPGETRLTYTALTTATTAILAQTATVTFTFTVTGATLAAVDRSFPVGIAIAGTSATLPEAGGVTGTVVYALTGPNGTDLTEVAGLTFTASSRVLSGTPTEAGTYELTYTVTPESNTATATFTLTVTGPTLAAVEDQAYTQDTAITDLTLLEAGSVGGGSSTLTPVVYSLTEVAGLTFDGVLAGSLRYADRRDRVGHADLHRHGQQQQRSLAGV